MQIKDKPTNTTIILDTVTTIERKAFSGCGGLLSITIGSSVTTIGFKAFNGKTVFISKCAQSLGA